MNERAVDASRPAATNPPAIQIRNLENRFGDFVVHQHLDLDVHDGEILAVVGGSGTGKSVLMRTILALRAPQAGEIRLFGQRLDPMAEHHPELERQAGVLF
ncbi:MAG: ATP-binding cassette domain-containing protein, partial [Pseudomonadota bacterium]